MSKARRCAVSHFDVIPDDILLPLLLSSNDSKAFHASVPIVCQKWRTTHSRIMRMWFILLDQCAIEHYPFVLPWKPPSPERIIARFVKDGIIEAIKQ